MTLVVYIVSVVQYSDYWEDYSLWGFDKRSSAPLENEEDIYGNYDDIQIGQNYDDKQEQERNMEEEYNSRDEGRQKSNRMSVYVSDCLCAPYDISNL